MAWGACWDLFVRTRVKVNVGLGERMGGGRVQLVWWGGLTRGALVDCPRLWCCGKECIELTFAPSSLTLTPPEESFDGYEQ